MSKPLLTPEQARFVKKHIRGRSYQGLTVLFNKQFGTIMRQQQLQLWAWRQGLSNGRDCRFLPGHNLGLATRFRPGQASPWKGQKGFCFPGSEKGWFKKGNVPANWMPVGSERMYAGYVAVKISNRKKPARRNWKMKNILIWEAANGPVPKGHVIAFADGNKFNFDLDNLMLVSRSEHAVMCSLGLYKNHAALTKTGRAVAALKMSVAGRKRELKKKRRKPYG